MRREDWVTVQGPVKEQQPQGMSHRGVLAKELQMIRGQPVWSDFDASYTAVDVRFCRVWTQKSTRAFAPCV